MARLYIDPHALIVLRDNREIVLTVSEWRLLRLLLAQGFVRHDEWRGAYASYENELRLCVLRLRRKLDMKIVAVRGIGYRYEQ